MSFLETVRFDDPLLNLAMVLVCGIVGGEICGLLRLPKVTGWIGTGILLRAMSLPGLDGEALQRFTPFMNFVLGYIAFTVGAALYFANLRNAGKRLSLLLLGEAIVTPIVVGLLLIYVGGMEMRPAILLAAIAIAGAPGTTVLVVQEARARGILTSTLIAAVALIDMVAVGMFVFVSSFLHVDNNFFEALGYVGFQVGTSFVIGASCASLALVLNRTIAGPAFLGPLMVAVILGSWGAAVGFGVSGILACSFAGITVTNLRHETVRSAEAYLHNIGGVLFALFFTLAGMRLDFSQVPAAFSLVVLYFFARLSGKYLSAFTALGVAGVPSRVRNYFGLALLPHGGVAVGLILLVQSEPHLQGVQEIVTTVGLAALAINQLLGPSAARIALTRVGEDHKDRPRLLDFLQEQRIVVDLKGNSREEVIKSLANHLYATTKLPVPQKQFVEMVMEREAEVTTCMGEGLMIPHTILKEGEEVKGVLGISTEGLDLKAPDNRPVHAVLLLATPESERSRHLEVLAAFATAITRDVNLREQLYHARSAAHAYNILHADDTAELNYFLEDVMERTRD
ncbi:PTS system fructose-specific EIIABC component [Rubripirellula obstinata]|uniref:PTS system fructose-specific EIIABC component n=1 Tax=Rubripirellula obstinata TaxID=406547 RepID=A0A5B1CJX1_9BACT|nr:PTS sugar transporter subunit IIA [Rubripirellula obstinata]KAA1260582.1 PTS system fructose-specific EIIABC component [Rubripirellula obstinata]